MLHSRNSAMLRMHGIPGSLEQEEGGLGDIAKGRYTKLASLDQDPSPGLVSCRPRGPGSVSPGNSPGSMLGPSLHFESRDDALEVSATPPPRKCKIHAQGHVKELTIWANDMHAWAERAEDNNKGMLGWVHGIQSAQDEGTERLIALAKCVEEIKEWAVREDKQIGQREARSDFLLQWAKAMDTWAKDAEGRLGKAEDDAEERLTRAEAKAEEAELLLAAKSQDLARRLASQQPAAAEDKEEEMGGGADEEAKGMGEESNLASSFASSAVSHSQPICRILSWHDPAACTTASSSPIRSSTACPTPLWGASGLPHSPKAGEEQCALPHRPQVAHEIGAAASPPPRRASCFPFLSALKPPHKPNTQIPKERPSSPFKVSWFSAAAAAAADDDAFCIISDRSGRSGRSNGSSIRSGERPQQQEEQLERQLLLERRRHAPEVDELKRQLAAAAAGLTAARGSEAQAMATLCQYRGALIAAQGLVAERDAEVGVLRGKVVSLEVSLRDLMLRLEEGEARGKAAEEELLEARRGMDAARQAAEEAYSRDREEAAKHIESLRAVNRIIVATQQPRERALRSLPGPRRAQSAAKRAPLPSRQHKGDAFSLPADSSEALPPPGGAPSDVYLSTTPILAAAQGPAGSHCCAADLSINSVPTPPRSHAGFAQGPVAAPPRVSSPSVRRILGHGSESEVMTSTAAGPEEESPGHGVVGTRKWPGWFF